MARCHVSNRFPNKLFFFDYSNTKYGKSSFLNLSRYIAEQMLFDWLNLLLITFKKTLKTTIPLFKKQSNILLFKHKQSPTLCILLLLLSFLFNCPICWQHCCKSAQDNKRYTHICQKVTNQTFLYSSWAIAEFLETYCFQGEYSRGSH